MELAEPSKLTTLAPPPQLPAEASLFLDFDGTLVDIAPRPDLVTADLALIDLLSALEEGRPGRIAVVSGRSIEQLDDMLGPIAKSLVVIGSHGAEWRSGGIRFQPDRPAILDAVAKSFFQFANEHPGAVVEQKSLGVALHYRLAPTAEYRAQLLATHLAAQHSLYLQCGKMMVELRTPGSEKGEAVRAMMRRAPMAGTIPWFIGDDLTDESAFVAVAEMDGSGILVGNREKTAAIYSVPDVAAVRAWLGVC